MSKRNKCEIKETRQGHYLNVENLSKRNIYIKKSKNQPINPSGLLYNHDEKIK